MTSIINNKTKVPRKPAPLITHDELIRLRLRQLADVFSRADSTLAGRKVQCKLHDGYAAGSAPAWSSHGVITFEPSLAPDVTTVEGLVRFNGLNYHELAHILYTPMDGSLVMRIRKDGLHPAYNALEDQRIETLLIAQYPSVAPFLVATVAEYFAERTHPTDHGQAWPVLYGRKYLPVSVRQYFRAAVPQNMNLVMVSLEKIIDEYVLLNVHDPRNEDRAYWLIDRYQQIMGSKQSAPDVYGHDANGACTGGATASTTGPVANKEQATQQQRVEEAIQQAKDAEDSKDDSPSDVGDTGSDADDSDPADGGQDGDADDADDSNAAGGGDTADGDSGDDGGDADGQDSEGNGAGKGSANTPAPTDPTDAPEWLKNIASQASVDPMIADDVRRQRDALGVGGRFRGALPNPARGTRPVSQGSKLAARRFGKQLQRLVSESDPGWHTHQSTGRVNVQRAMQGSGLDDVFDQWDAGKQDADSLELVLLVDTSGSMNAITDTVMEALWVIKAGAEMLGGNTQVSVIEYEDTSRYVYAPGEKASRGQVRITNGGGGTNPRQGIEEAIRIFHSTRRARKLCVFISDGSWDDYRPTRQYYAPADDWNDAQVSRMNQHGITTACVFIVKPGRQWYGPDLATTPIEKIASEHGHNAKVFAVVHDIDDLVAFGKSLVTATLRK